MAILFRNLVSGDVMPKDKDWITATQAAQRLGITRDTAYRLLSDGKMPGAYRVGWQWRISIAGLEQAMQARKDRDAAALAAQVAADAAVAAARFVIGDRVEKWVGDYVVVGEVRMLGTTKAGKLRYVIEIEPQGFLHIYKEGQLRHATDRATGTPPQSP